MDARYHTAKYQRYRKNNALACGIIFLAALVIDVCQLSEGPLDFIFAFGAVLGFVGYFSHRKYLKKLMAKEALQDSQVSAEET